MALPLTNYTVALPETRQLDVLAGLLERRGATVWRCPLVSIHDAPDPTPIQAWLREFIAHPPKDVIFLTGEGIRRLLGVAERAGLRDNFVARLGEVRKITRGPKPARVLKELGMKADIPAAAPTTDGVIESLKLLYSQGTVVGRQVAVQLYGTEANPKLMGYLHSVGIQPRVVAPYVYADASEDAKVVELIDAMVVGQVDVITFTSQPQLHRLQSVARKFEREPALQDGLAKVKVAAIGPVMADVLVQAGIRVDLMPQDSFFMKPLVTELVRVLTGAEDEGAAD